jgi:hypothetical protein
VQPPTDPELSPGGVYVAYNLGCERGCDEIARGDLIQAVDGRAVRTRSELLVAGLASGRPVALEVLRRKDQSRKRVTISARPREDLSPLTGAPPLWTVGAESLARTPTWARQLMYSHAMPAVGFVDIDGGWVTGRTVYGRKHLIVVWPDIQVFERRYGTNFRDQMAVFHGVLQKAQSTLLAHDVSILFAVCGGANDTTVRAELSRMTQLGPDGQPLPALPTYRCPSVQDATYSTSVQEAPRQVQATGSQNPAKHVGLEHAGAGFFSYVRGFPVVVLVDQGGIVRWHSNGYNGGPQNTILAAVGFALRELDETAAEPLAQGPGEAKP